MVKKGKVVFLVSIILYSVYIISSFKATSPPDVMKSKECIILNKEKEAQPIIKLDPKNKKWLFALNLKTFNCNGLIAVIDIYYLVEGNSILGSTCANMIEIKNNILKFECTFTDESQYPFPATNYYYKIEIIPELQNQEFLRGKEFNEPIRIIQEFEIGDEKEKQEFFVTYIEKLLSLVKISNLLFTKVMQYYDHYLELKGKVEEGSCNNAREEKAQCARTELECFMRGNANCDCKMDPLHQILCTMWRNYLEKTWVSFEKNTEAENEEDNTPDISPNNKLKDKEKILFNETIRRTIEYDDNLKSLLSTLNISLSVPEGKKEVEWIVVYNTISEYINSFYGRRIIFLGGIIERISELYSKSLKQYTLCLKDILKDGMIRELEDWGNCPKTEKLLLKEGYTKANLYMLFKKTTENIEQRIYEAKYPEEVRRLRNDLLSSIDKIYNFFNIINKPIKEKKKVPLTVVKDINEVYDEYLKHFSDLKELYNQPPRYKEYSNVYKDMVHVIDNQRQLLIEFNNVFDTFKTDIKSFRGYPKKIEPLFVGISRSLTDIAQSLKDSELDSILRKSWSRIVLDYEKEQIEKIEIVFKPEQIQAIFDSAKTLVKNGTCIFKYEQPKTGKQKLISLDTLFDELKENLKNMKEVNEYISKQSFFDGIEKDTYFDFLCCRKLVYRWIEEILHENTFDTLLVTLIKKYSDAILNIKFPLDSKKYQKLDILVVELANIYSILTAKQNKELLTNEINTNIKSLTVKLLEDLKTNASSYYTIINTKFKTEFTNAGDDIEKLRELSKMLFKELTIELKDEEDNITTKNILSPYFALLIAIFNYTASTQNSEYIKPIISYIDENFIDEKLRVELIPKTVEKIGIDKIMSLDEFRKSINDAIQNSSKEKVLNKISESLNAVIERIQKKAPEAKTFEEAYNSAPESDRNEYDRLEKENMKIQLQSHIFCDICSELKKLKEKILEKLSK